MQRQFWSNNVTGVLGWLNEHAPANARIWLHESWSGDLIAAVLSYLPEGTKPDVLSYWYQPTGGPIFNDIITVATSGPWLWMR